MGHEAGLTRRQALAGGAAAAAGFALSNVRLAQALAASGPSCGSLHDIEHVIFFIQENRSFDHYFGRYRGVRGFADSSSTFAQPGFPAAGYGGVLRPFHITASAEGQCTTDPTHNWGPQHRSWNDGAMDGFVREHLAADGAAAGPLTMGYYERADLPLHYALADAFTLCDAYHCSVIGPSDPNHLYSISASLGDDGSHGGPIVSTLGTTDRLKEIGKLSWTTMPEQLQARGITWKSYSLDNFSPEADPVFRYFKNIVSNPALAARALLPTFPVNFLLDLELGALPQVSWIYAPDVDTAHPPTPIAWDENAISQVLQALLARPEVWAKTALFVTYDENGGFFDHVAPPVAPPGTPGEYLTAALPAAADGIAGPIGLGFRVPMLVISPFARGGFVCSDTFDHTSMLRFLETRFGAEVPNLSAWRRTVTGDMTTAFNFASVDTSTPALPEPSLVDPRVLAPHCVEAAGSTVTDQLGVAPVAQVLAGLAGTYPVPPAPQVQPGQEPGAARRPSGPVACATPSPGPSGPGNSALLRGLLALLGR